MLYTILRCNRNKSGSSSWVTVGRGDLSERS